MPAIPPEPAPYPFLGADDAPEPRESDYGPDGLYRHGPQMAIPITTRLARLTLSRCADPRPSPTAAREQQDAKQQQALEEVARQNQPKPKPKKKPKKSRAARVLASVQGWPVGRVSASRAA